MVAKAAKERPANHESRVLKLLPRGTCEGAFESAIMAQACRRLDMLLGSWGKQEEGNPHVTAGLG